MKNLIGGKFVDSKSTKWIEIRNPVRGTALVVLRVARVWSVLFRAGLLFDLYTVVWPTCR